MSDIIDPVLDPALRTFVATLTNGTPDFEADALLTRIHASRASSAATPRLLDDRAPTRLARRRASRWWLRLGVAAALGVVVPMSWQQWRTPGASPRAIPITSPTTPPITSNPVALLAPWPALAGAQGAPARPVAAFAPVTGLDASRIHPGRRTYVRSSASDSHDLLPHAVYEEETTRRLVGARAFWLIVTTEHGWQLREPDAAQRALRVDSLWLDATSLQPMSRVYHIGEDGVVRQRFTGTTLTEVDSILVRREQRSSSTFRAREMLRTTTAFDATRPIVHTEQAMRLLLRALPLTATWRGSVAVAQIGESRDMAMSLGVPRFLNLHVAGVDTVQTYSGRFPCWRVQLDVGETPELWFVSQETGETLLSLGAFGPVYTKSEVRLLYGFEETQQAPRLQRR